MKILILLGALLATSALAEEGKSKNEVEVQKEASASTILTKIRTMTALKPGPKHVALTMIVTAWLMKRPARRKGRIAKLLAIKSRLHMAEST